MKKLTIIMMVIVFAAFMTAASGALAEDSYRTTLTGKSAAPPVATKATGEASFTVANGGKEIVYTLAVKGIENVTMAHIHAGKKGVNGPPVAGLYGGPRKEGVTSGELAKGTITDKDLVGPLAGKTIGDLIKMIKSKDAYVNVHTDKNPAGEIRGQIIDSSKYDDQHQAD
jgi:hypothetical protein